MKSVLENIKLAVEQLEWSSKTKENKAINLCISIFNLFAYDGGNFYQYRGLSKQYFLSIIKTQSYVYEIKRKLIEAGILEVNHSYSVEGGRAKGYRFNNSLLTGDFNVVLSGTKSGTKYVNDVVLSGTKSVTKYVNDVVLSGTKRDTKSCTQSSIIFQESNLSSYHICGTKSKTEEFTSSTSINNQPYHICGTKSKTEEIILNQLDNISFKPIVKEFIYNYTISPNQIQINEEIKDDYLEVMFENGPGRYSKEKALKFAKEQGLDLICFNKKCYINTVDDFIIKKTKDLKLIYSKSVFDVENKLFRVSRNDTNKRLDYNLTNMKSDLLEYLIYDGEELIELDIANAQFAILNYIMPGLDQDFSDRVKAGTLYDIIPKEKMFRVAFDKVKKDQDDVRSVYPKTMEIIDSYKKSNSYKSFSIMLQNAESKIMIDGVFNRLIEKGFKVFTIHDAVRVKKSQVEEVKSEIENYFKEIGFECLLRIKKKKVPEPKIEINHKGIYNVTITDSLTDRKLFWDKAESLWPNVSETIMIYLNLFEKEKTVYYYGKYTARKNKQLLNSLKE